jgi:hypothetical protein
MNRQHKSKSGADLRLCAATIGASAVVAMTAIGLMVTQEHDGTPVAKSTTMTVGSTSTQTTPPNAPSVAEAKPLIKGPAALPPEEEAAK